MSEIITSSNIDFVIQKNEEIGEGVSAQIRKLQLDPSLMKAASMPQLAFLILQSFGLIQIPIEDKYWSGAIYVKDRKIIPVINTALPRANQYFTAWHEIYHLIFDRVSFDHFIESENMVEERKAEYFAACMLLSDVGRYYAGLSMMDFMSKVFWCMSVFQAPYKAVLISLYEDAARRGDGKLKNQIKEVIDLKIDDIPERFRKLGLDDSLVLPSFVINTSYLMERIQKKETVEPELKYHRDNEEFLKNIIEEIQMIVRHSRQ